MRKAYWLITYYCAKATEHFGESVWQGTLGQWRIEHLKYRDGPYILIAAHEISQDEFDKLDGVIG